MNKDQIINFSSQITKSLAQVEEAISVFKTDLVEATERQTNFLQDGMDHAQEQSDLAARIEAVQGPKLTMMTGLSISEGARCAK